MEDTEVKNPSEEQFETWFKKQQAKGKNPAITLRNSAFKLDFNVGKASVLKCPACPSLTDYPGTLYPIVDAELGYFVCKKCNETFFIQVPNRAGGLEDLIDEIKRTKKTREAEYNKLKKGTSSSDPTPGSFSVFGEKYE